MIKIKIKKENEIIKNIVVKGHANFDEHGKDIVCASVSSIVITTINALINLDKQSVNYKESDGLIIIDILKRDNTTNILIRNMLDLLKELEKQYKNYIKIDN